MGLKTKMKGVMVLSVKGFVRPLVHVGMIVALVLS